MATQFNVFSMHIPPLYALIPSCLAVLTVLYTLSRVIYNIYFHPLASYPGPKSHASTRLLYVYYHLTGQLPYRCHQLHTTYGDVVRIAPDELSFTNADAWKDIYGYRHGHQPMPKDMSFYNIPSNGAHSLITASRADHSRQRRLIAHAFSDKALREQEPLIKGYVDLLIQRLHERSSTGPLDMVSWYNWTTFDLIGDLAFGESFGCLENCTYHPWISMLFSTIKAGAFLSSLKRYGIKWMMVVLVPRGLLKSRSENLQLTKQKVMKRLEQGTSRPDFMSHILRHNDEKGMKVPEIITNSTLLIVAGSETTATLLSGATYHLLKNPRVVKKLQREVREAFKVEEDIDIAGVNGLEYMLAVLDEALRMYPPVPTGLPRRVPGDGDVINDRWVPGGTAVSVNNWSTYRSEANFREPNSFIPERFLDDPRFASDNKHALQPFSLGPRNCVGRNLAYAEMRLILAQVLWNFDMELAPESDNWANQKIFSFWQKGPLYVKLTPVVR
ncbi:hypothetical protein VC83_03574 [Pseudogymnoascus destructans]|uniref:Isotrichodermin C-15 hydroxylase n=2 Tax=Pseudogymnoascus destructans TaxID=655981 RepID=L8FXX2_PSED2|nr:uncharacterized protein VC83_03574 [Pseudogymnoascus destructans]ELR05414.1 hypothetical protein GMDG_01709 [Pseudogymnoascus destructans 20631-21]OAF60538.1 hypothetical protein VC83_03574 [Pseudogymnoascus destructans]